MSKDQDQLGAQVARLADTVERLSASVTRLEKVNAPRLAGELAAERLREKDRRMTAIAAIEDHAERARAIGELLTEDDIKYACGEIPDDDRLVATLEAATQGTRQRILNAIPEGRLLDLAIRQLPAPRRIAAKLAPGIQRIATTPVRGVTKADNYPGLQIERGDRHVELASTWSKRLQIDEDLRGHVEGGTVLVEDLPEAESRHLLRCEVLSREPDKRPQLRFER